LRPVQEKVSQEYCNLRQAPEKANYFNRTREGWFIINSHLRRMQLQTGPSVGTIARAATIIIVIISENQTPTSYRYVECLEKSSK
jgi:hypothetical protein